MKFLESEHTSIVNLLEARGFNKEQFSFRKKKGLLFIQLENIQMAFCFYRKSESSFTEDMKFEEVTSYFVGANRERQVTSWDDVLSEINSWLDKA